MTEDHGRLFVIEGPKGSGKTTTARLLADRLPKTRGRNAVLLEQPSDTPFGAFLRGQGENSMTGHAYAMALAADRLMQYNQTILPALERGVDVVLARFTPSSLVLQRMDGVPLEDVWTYNRHTPAPDMLFYLHHSGEELSRRLAGRNRQTRIQSLGTPDMELRYYEEAHEFLEQRGWRQHRLYNSYSTPDELVASIIRIIATNF